MAFNIAIKVLTPETEYATESLCKMQQVYVVVHLLGITEYARVYNT